MDWTSLLVGMQQSQAYRPQVLAPIQTEAPTSPMQWALFGVGAIVVVGALAYALRDDR